MRSMTIIITCMLTEHVPFRMTLTLTVYLLVHRAVVMMVVQPGEKNSADQRMLEYTLWNQYVFGCC